MRKHNLTGKRFGKLTVLYEIGSGKDGIEWACECDCGNWTVAATKNLNSGRVISCGCAKKIAESSPHLRHLYSTYYSLRSACINKKNKNYANFGAKGISFCSEWMNDVGAFVKWSLDHGYSPKAKLYRFDPEDNYFPRNCYWWIPNNSKAPD